MDEMIAIPHQGRKPEWLEDDARIGVFAPNSTWPMSSINWRETNAAGQKVTYFLPADHWAAPVLRAGLTPWNPALQFPAPADRIAGDCKIMRRNGQILPVVTGMRSQGWKWIDDDNDIIGYEAEPAPQSPSTETPSTKALLAEMDTAWAEHVRLTEWCNANIPDYFNGKSTRAEADLWREREKANGEAKRTFHRLAVQLAMSRAALREIERSAL